MSNPLDHKIIALTGGASGMARAAAILAASQGADVLLGDVDGDGLRETAAEVEKLGRRAVCQLVDIRQPDQVRAFFEAAAQLGSLDGAVLAAGAAPKGDALEMSLDQWNDVLRLNLTGTFLCAQAAARLMVAGGQGGSIVTYASEIALKGAADRPAYAASKAGIIGFTKSFALALAKYMVRVNAVAPGLTLTPPVIAHNSPEMRNAAARDNPMGRLGQPEDIASAVCFLLSDAAAYITGQTLHVNGGGLMI